MDRDKGDRGLKRGSLPLEVFTGARGGRRRSLLINEQRKFQITNVIEGDGVVI